MTGSQEDFIDLAIFWLVMVPAGIVLLAMWAVLLAPFVIPYLLLRLLLGHERATDIAVVLIALVATAITIGLIFAEGIWAFWRPLAPLGAPIQ